MTAIVKVGGGDRELGAAIIGGSRSYRSTTCHEASRLVLAQIDGVHRATSSVSTHTWAAAYGGVDYADLGGPYDYATTNRSMDSGGKFVVNGGCVYIDLGHPEMCTPECQSADDYVTYVYAMLGVVGDAARRASAELPEDEHVVIFVDNSDRQGNSYGSHLNMSVSRELWHAMFREPMFPHLTFLASFQASSIVLTGGGKVGSEDDAPAAALQAPATGYQAPGAAHQAPAATYQAPAATFQVSRRADFIKTFVGEQTTFNRPMINARDEALGEEARLHCIFFDSVLFPAANYLQFGQLQLIAAMMEAGPRWMPMDLLLESPVLAVRRWSRDSSLQARQPTLTGKQVTAVEHQRMLVDTVGRFIASGRLDGMVADAQGILAYWDETLKFLETGDDERAARRIEWLAKKRVLQTVMENRDDLDWSSAAIRRLDMMFSDLDEHRGIYWKLVAGDAVDRLPSPADILHFRSYPPQDTRARVRGTLIRRLGAAGISSADWATMRLRDGYRTFAIDLPDPADPGPASLEELIDEVKRDGSLNH
ncbi:MAG: proteasome accessory factor PafA2 family protein [Gammaproteobacteria bacterium]|nr:proteasome accessory factor PafA2 family protein [Gammaproteobacteria bacterium]